VNAATNTCSIKSGEFHGELSAYKMFKEHSVSVNFKITLIATILISYANFILLHV
jgi:hypothetical protein